jgi:hypothetical protein
LTVGPDLKVRISPKAKTGIADIAAQELLWKFDGAAVSTPPRFAPDTTFLLYHNKQIFLGK